MITLRNHMKEEFYEICPVFLNVTNIMIGPGILTIPFAYYSAKPIAAILATVLVGLFSYLSFYLYITSSQTLKTHSVRISFSEAFPSFSAVVDIVMLSYCFLAAVSFLVVVGAQLPVLLQTYCFSSVALWKLRTALLCTVFLVYLLPISFLEELRKIRFLAFFTLLIGVLFCTCAFFLLLTNPKKTNHSFFAWGGIGGLLVCLSILSVSFNPQLIAIQLRIEYATLSVKSFNVTVAAAFFFVAVLYVCFGLTVAARFGSATSSNAIENFVVNKAVFVVVSIAQAFSVCFSFPAFFQNMRVSFFGLIGQWIPQNRKTFWLSTVSLNTLVFIVALLVEDLGKLNELNGAVFGGLIIFMVPSLIVLGKRKSFDKHTVLLAVMLSSVGIVLISLCTFNFVYY